MSTEPTAHTLSESELWAQYVAKNPSFNGNGSVTLSAAGLRKLFSQTYNVGHDRGFANGKAWASTRGKVTQNRDIFSQMFGGGV